MLDIIQSFFIKGVIILIIIQAMISLQQTLYERSRKAQLEQEMFQMSAIISSDIRCVGSDANITRTNYFISADTSQLQFNIGDTLNFVIPPPVPLRPPILISYNFVKTGNYFELRRTVGSGTALPVGRNLTQFQCKFYDSDGNSLTPTPLSEEYRLKIKSIAILARMETSTSTQDTTWSIWQTKIYPQNL